MSLRRNLNQGNSVGVSGSPKSQNKTKRVADIILSSTHRAYSSPDDIGIIFFTEVGFNQESLDTTALPQAKPLNRNNFIYPNIGELVQIFESTDKDFYNDLGGNISNVTTYYTPAINIHNNTTNNALPTQGKSKKSKPKKEPNLEAFSFKEEFKSIDREVARKKLNQYLRELGYTSGTNDPRAPRYRLSQNAKGEYIFRLDNSEQNEEIAIKLGNYFKENPDLAPLTPSEGDSIMEGKNGQRIRFTTTGPTGTNTISNNVTDTPDDGNPNIGDKAMILSLGNGSQENVTNDAASIYMLENQSINIDATSTNIDSLNSTYEPLTKPLEELSKAPPSIIPQPLPSEELVIQPMTFDFSNVEIEQQPTPPLPSPSPDPDPVFAALDEAQDEGLLRFDMESIDIAGTEYDSETETQPEVTPPPGEGDVNPIPETGENYYNKNINAVREWNSGGIPTFKNKSGKTLILNRPTISLSMTKTTKRTIKYLVLHTAGSADSWTAADLTGYFFNDRDRKGPKGRIPTTNPDTDGPWNTGGYHWVVDRQGNATRIYSDDISTNGAKGINSNSIHLNWIGGFSPTGQPLNKNMLQPQAFKFKRLIFRYIDTYPNIKVLGHNQVSNKPCPLFNVPTFCQNIGVDEDNIETRVNFANRGFYSGWDGAELKQEARRLALIV